MPGIDPQRVELEAAGSTITVRVKPSGDQRADERYEQTFTVPQFLDPRHHFC